MIHILIGVIANILRTYTIYRFMELFYISNSKNRLLKISIYTLFVIATSGGYYLFHSLFINILTNILGLLLIVSLYRGSLLKDGLSVLCIYSVNIVMESLVFSITKIDNSSNLIMESINECITSTGLLVLVNIIEKTKAIKNNKFNVSFPLWLGLISVPTISILIILILVNKRIYNESCTEIEILGILIINITIFYLYGALQDYYKQKVEKEAFFSKMKIYSNQLDVLKSSNQKIREIWHDMKHHLGELKYLAIQNEISKLLEYIDAMEKHMSNNDEHVASGNKDIDGTLNYLLQTAKHTLEDVHICISVPEGIEIHNYLFNVVLGNLLENAINASAKSSKKYLKVSIKLKQNVLYINIENSYSGQIKLENQQLMTTKPNAEEHGIGMKSVKRMVDEMNGLLNIKWEEDIFYVSVMFYLNNLMKWDK